MRSYVDTVVGRIRKSFTPEEAKQFGDMLDRISNEMMPETDNI